MDKNLSRRERKKIETRQRLMEAALRLFREHGYDDATVEQIAGAADVAKGTFFNYFETKDAILPALAGWRFQQLEARLLHCPVPDSTGPGQGAPASPVARIKLALCLVADDPLADPILARRLFAASVRLPGRRLPGRHCVDISPARTLINLLAEQVRQAQVAGEIRTDLDPVYLGGVIRAMFFQQLMTWHHGCRPAPLPELLNGMVDLLLDGVAGPNWRHSV